MASTEKKQITAQEIPEYVKSAVLLCLAHYEYKRGNFAKCFQLVSAAFTTEDAPAFIAGLNLMNTAAVSSEKKPQAVIAEDDADEREEEADEGAEEAGPDAEIEDEENEGTDAEIEAAIATVIGGKKSVKAAEPGEEEKEVVDLIDEHEEPDGAPNPDGSAPLIDELACGPEMMAGYDVDPAAISKRILARSKPIAAAKKPAAKSTSKPVAKPVAKAAAKAAHAKKVAAAGFTPEQIQVRAIGNRLTMFGDKNTVERVKAALNL